MRRLSTWQPKLLLPQAPGHGLGPSCQLMISPAKHRSSTLLAPSVRLAGGGVEEQLGVPVEVQHAQADQRTTMIEVEQVAQGACQGVNRAVADALAVQPVVLDELDHRGLRRQGAVDEVRLAER